MLKFYYKACADLIIRSKKYESNEFDWKSTVFLTMTVLCGSIILFFIYITKYLGGEIFNILDFGYDNQTSQITKIKGIIYLGVPSALFNFYMLHFNKKYDIIEEKYKEISQGYFKKFIILSLFFYVITIIFIVCI